MNGLTLDRLSAALSRMELFRWSVVVGGVVVAIGLAVLAWTRWGQNKPLRKCVILSVLAHFLLALFVATLPTVAHDPPGRGRGEVYVRISDDEGGDASFTVEGDDSAGAEPMPGEPPPAVDETSPPEPSDTAAVERPPAPVEAAADAATGAEPEATPEEPQQAPDPPLAPLPDPVDLPPEQDVAVDAEPPTALDNAALPIEVPSENTTIDESADRDNLPPDRPTAPQPFVATSARPASPAAEAPPDIYEARFGDDRIRAALAGGGSAETEAAVESALVWLATNQESDGRWDPARHGAGQARRGQGQHLASTGARADTAVTGLALLALMGAGNTHTEGAYRDVVARGLEFLLSSQGRDGSMAGDAEPMAAMYCHGMATCALSEAYGLSRDPELLRPLKRALAYTVAAQTRDGGWRYRPGDAQGDTSQLGWQLMSLRSAELAGLPIPAATRTGMVRFLKSVASGKHDGLASYRSGERVTRTMTAEALVCRQFLGMNRDNPAGEEAGDWLLTQRPGDGEDNLYYWYYGTLAMFQLGGEHWDQWNEALKESLVNTQRTRGSETGSWDPDPVWGSHGGRVYSTALGALCMEVYYRYLPLYARQDEDE